MKRRILTALLLLPLMLCACRNTNRLTESQTEKTTTKQTSLTIASQTTTPTTPATTGLRERTRYLDFANISQKSGRRYTAAVQILILRPTADTASLQSILTSRQSTAKNQARSVMNRRLISRNCHIGKHQMR